MSIGQHYILRDKKHKNVLVEGLAISVTPKRIRLETGEYSGEVLMTNQFDILEKCEHSEAAGFLALAWE